MKTQLSRAIMVLCLCVSSTYAQIQTEVEVIGFSEDGAFVAYEIKGQNTVSNECFSLIQIVDVAGNEFYVDDIILESDECAEATDRRLLSEKNRRLAILPLSRKEIIQGNRGTIAYKADGEELKRGIEFTIVRL